MCGFKCQNIGGKTGHFFCTVEVDTHDIVPLKFTTLRVIFIVAGNNNNYWCRALICGFSGMLWSSLYLYIYIHVTCDLLKCDCCRVINVSVSVNVSVKTSTDSEESKICELFVKHDLL